MFKTRLFQLRKEHDLTQEQLAEKVGVVKTTISRYENGTRDNPTLPVLQAMSKYFDVSISYLVGESDNRIPEYTINELTELFQELPEAKKMQAISYIRFLKGA